VPRINPTEEAVLNHDGHQERIMTLRTGLAALSIGAVLASLAACSSSGGGSSSDYKFAAIGPLTGDSASYGTNLRDGIDLAVKSINNSGGIDGKKVSVDFYDDKCDPSEGANAASRIVSDGSYFGVMGPVCSSAALAEGPVLERANIAMLAGDTTSPELTGRFDNFARTIPSDSQEAVKLVQLATHTLGKSRLGVLYASDDFGQPIYQGIKAAAASQGATIVDAETFTPSQTKDFTPALTKIASSHPQLVILVGYYNDIGVAVSQFGDAGLGGVPNLSTAGVDNPGFIKLAGKAAEGSHVFSYYNADNTTPANKKFVQEFQDAYHRLPNEQAAYGYELLFIYKKAIEAGATKDNLISKVKQVVYEGPTGTTRFKSNGDVSGKVGVVLTVQGGSSSSTTS
jgi:branched-chain amino acid transport system substrate-binding protein